MAGREGYKRSVRFNINILTIIRVNNLGFDHLIYKRFPKICYINFIAHVKLGNSFKHIYTLIPCVSGNNAVCVFTADRQRGVGKIRCSLSHIFCARTVINRQLNVNSRDRYVAEYIAVYTVIGEQKIRFFIRQLINQSALPA